MRRTHMLTALAIFATTGIVCYSPSLAQAGQWKGITHLGEIMTNAAAASVERQSLIHKVGDAYSGMTGGTMRPETMTSPQGGVPGNQPYSTGDYKSSSPSSDGRYGSTPSNPSDSYLKKESSGSSTGPYGGPYGGSVYGGLPSTPSADPMIKDLSR